MGWWGYYLVRWAKAEVTYHSDITSRLVSPRLSSTGLSLLALASSRSCSFTLVCPRSHPLSLSSTLLMHSRLLVSVPSLSLWLDLQPLILLGYDRSRLGLIPLARGRSHWFITTCVHFCTFAVTHTGMELLVVVRDH